MSCILCLEKSTKPVSEFIEIFSEEGLNLEISTIINKHFCLKPNKNVSNEQQVCRACWYVIRDFHLLYERVMEAHHCLETKADVVVVVDDSLPSDFLAKSEHTQNNLHTNNIFDSEIKLEVNELELLPQLEIIEETPGLSERALRATRRSRQTDTETSPTKDMCKRIKRESSLDIDIDLGLTHDIFAETETEISKSSALPLPDNSDASKKITIKKRGRPRKSGYERPVNVKPKRRQIKKLEDLEKTNIKMEHSNDEANATLCSRKVKLENKSKEEQGQEQEQEQEPEDASSSADENAENNCNNNIDFDNCAQTTSDSESDSEHDTESSWPAEQKKDKYAVIYRKVPIKPKKYRKHPKPLVPRKRMTRDEIEARNARQMEYDTVIGKFFENMRCPKCQLLVKCFGDMRAHFRISHNDDHGFVECCGRRFITRKTLAEHVYVHWNPEYFKCNTCGKTCLDSKQLETHENSHLPNPPPSKYKKIFHCDKCPKTFSSKASFEHHSFVKHVPKEEYKFECPQCNKKLPTDRKLKEHLKYSHDPQNSVICDKCGKTLKSGYSLKKHNEIEHSDKPKPMPTPQQCEICGTWLRHMAGLKQHMKSMHEDTTTEHRCHICNKVSSTSRALKRHIYHNHECAKKFKCTMCEKAFKRAQDLREHTSVHTGEVLYTCPNCPMNFFSNANMYKHRQRLHRAEWEADRKKPIPPNIMGQAKQGSKLVKLKRSTHSGGGGNILTTTKSLERLPLRSALTATPDAVDCENIELPYDNLEFL